MSWWVPGPNHAGRSPAHSYSMCTAATCAASAAVPSAGYQHVLEGCFRGLFGGGQLWCQQQQQQLSLDVCADVCCVAGRCWRQSCDRRLLWPVVWSMQGHVPQGQSCRPTAAASAAVQHFACAACCVFAQLAMHSNMRGFFAQLTMHNNMRGFYTTPLALAQLVS